MAWLEITIDTTGGRTQEAAAILTAQGFSDLVIEDETELESFLAESKDYWDYIDEKLQQRLKGLARIRLYLECTDSASLVRLKELCTRLGLPMNTAPLPETDWSESWKENYPPLSVGEGLIVLPVWLAQEPTPRRKIILDPGLTFGTGAHPSTQMVMEAMEQAVRPGSRCLDLGSGSGILSITALRLGAEAAIGVDIDPKAEDAARQNAAYNGFFAPEFTALTGNVLTDQHLMGSLSGTYDVVFVNIVADVIIALAPILPVFLEQQSTLICSGILDSRAGDVRSALEKAGLTITQVKAKDTWRCFVVQKANRAIQ